MKKVKNSHISFGLALGCAFWYLASALQLVFGIAALFLATGIICRAIEK